MNRVNRRRWSVPTGDVEGCLERMRCRRDELNVLRERTESGREFQIVGAAARKERKPKVRLVWELVSGQQRKMTRERLKDGIEQGDARDVSVCMALKAREASLNFTRHWIGNRWSSRCVLTEDRCDGFFLTTFATARCIGAASVSAYWSLSAFKA